ncbi:MAG: PTS transporter subunit EIIC, partial [Mycoplasmataceae bacterium]|nr:PTS transporter subunit EIIC [Mycoplasmataceae bacterium]
PILGAYVAFGMVGKIGILPGFLVGLMSRGDFTNTLLQGSSDAWYAPVTGVSSGFIGAIFGAILVAAIVIVAWKMMAKLPKQLNGIKTILLMPLITGLVTIVLFWILNIPLIYMSWGLQEFLGLFEDNMALAWILGLIIGLMMAIDMGGPINKAAYIVGVTSLDTIASGETGTVTMAIVMAAGMIPPLATAFATAIRKKYWESDDIEAGYSNWVLGASFISEGAIPFAAKYPKTVMPGILVGSAITGMLVGIFQITLGAPHGGIMVFALVSTSFGSLSGGSAIAFGVIMYIASILIGTVIGGLTINYLMSLQYKKGKLPVQKNSADALVSTVAQIVTPEGAKIKANESKKTELIKSKTNKTKTEKIKTKAINTK